MSCSYCFGEETSIEPLLKVCSCTRVNPIHRACLDHFRTINSQALYQCHTCKDNYKIVSVEPKNAFKNKIYYKIRLICELSVCAGLFIGSSIFVGSRIKSIDNYYHSPINRFFNFYGHGYNILGSLSIVSLIGSYGLWKESGLIKETVKQFFEGFLEVLRRIPEETP